MPQMDDSDCDSDKDSSSDQRDGDGHDKLQDDIDSSSDDLVHEADEPVKIKRSKLTAMKHKDSRIR